jgi:uncharacterized protein (DUF488 family)
MPSERFIDILAAHGVTLLVDVRTIPKSRHNPQFSQDKLQASLLKAGIQYVHCKELGGLRRPLKDSKNTAWRNASFRGYADYMQTPEFASYLERLIALCEEHTVAIMCAEGNPFRCHRSLIADALTVRRFSVVHISSKKPGRKHVLTPFAKLQGDLIVYPSV